MDKAREALADVRRWLCDNLSDGEAGEACGMLSVVSRHINELEDENARLRELVRGLYWCNDKEWNKGACDDCPIRGRAVGRCETAMRELGVEVYE